MRKFDVANRRQSGTLVVSIQSNHLSELDTRLVVPLVPAGSRNPPIKRLNPIIEFNGTRYYAATENAAAIKVADMGTAVGTLSEYGEELQSAFEFLTVGF